MTTHIVCSWCDAVLKQGDASGAVSHGICPACAARLLGALKKATRRASGLVALVGQLGERPSRSHGDPGRDRLIDEYLVGLRTDVGVTLWRRAVEGSVWIRVASPDGIELVDVEVLATDDAGNWYGLTTSRLEQRTWSAAEVLSTSHGEE